MGGLLLIGVVAVTYLLLRGLPDAASFAPLVALIAVGALGAVAAALAAWRYGVRPRGVAPALLGTALALLLLPDAWTRLLASDYKDLTQALRCGGRRSSR